MQEESGKQIRQSLDCSLKDGAFYSAMVGFGDTYVPAFAIKLGATDSAIGLLAALPQFFSSVFQLFAAGFTTKLKSRKIFVTFGALVHGLLWIPMAFLALFPSPYSIPLLIALFSVYVTVGMFLNPAWASWIADLVPENERGRYFGFRNEVTGFALFLATFAAGAVLGLFNSQVMLGFAAIFGIAFIARIISVFYLGRTHEPPMQAEGTRAIGFMDFFTSPSHRNGRLFVFYIGLMGFASTLASPFFAVYMLRDLGMDFTTFALVTSVSVLVKLVSMPYWGRLADRHGNRMIFTVAGMLVPFVPIVWLFSSDVGMLMLFQAFSGFAWAGFELASFNAILSSSDRDTRASYVANYNFFSGMMNFMGALLGGIIASWLTGVNFLFWTGLLLLFLVSGCLRLVVSFFFLPRLEDRRFPTAYAERGFFWKAVAVYPAQGGVQQLLNGWNFTRKAAQSSAEISGKVVHGGVEAGGRVISTGAEVGGKVLETGAEVGIKAIENGARAGTTAVKTGVRVGGRVISAGADVGGKALGTSASTSAQVISKGADIGKKALKGGAAIGGAALANGARAGSKIVGAGAGLALSGIKKIKWKLEE